MKMRIYNKKPLLSVEIKIKKEYKRPYKLK